jgi:hypothetical protein
MRDSHVYQRIWASALAALLLAVGGRSMADGAYRNFRAAIYVSVNSTREFEDARVLAQQFSRVAGQLRFDKVYIETYRSGVFADEAALERTKQFFIEHGIEVAGGIAYSAPEHGGHGGQFSALDYENPHDRDECRHAAELTARHFDEIILDDFFFFNSKSDADIAAKGSRSWTRYRLERMREVANELVLKPARAVNPKVKVIIKYPNWYEHFQALGYDLDAEAKAFDSIYTGTETRDPEITDQLLQQYESYEVFRFLDNVRPHGGNRGGWVDTYDTRYVDRFPEQLWDTMFARAPEITLFNWTAMASTDALQSGDRQAWSSLRTSFDWNEVMRSARDAGVDSPGWARAAGYALEQVDRVVGRLGKPIGIAAYKPYQSSGEDYLHNYLGNIGLPIELTPQFPTDAPLVLLTESAAHDPAIVAKIRQQLNAGKSVVITSGLLQALQGRGIRDIAEVEVTGRKVAVRDFVGAFGAGRGVSLNDTGRPSRGLLFPEIRFYTNDAWPLIRGVAQARGVPILLMDRYSRGALYILNIPDNPGDLYELPQPLLKVLRSYLQADMPVRLDAPDHVSLFTYDNGTFIVQSFRHEPATVTVSVAGLPAQIHDLMSSEATAAEPAKPTPAGSHADAPVRSEFRVVLAPHSYRVFSTP